MNTAIKQQILRLRLANTQDQIFLEKLAELQEELGKEIPMAAFSVLTGVEFPPHEVEKHWQQAMDHRQKLFNQLGRELNLTSVLCDYLQTASLLVQPRLIETSVFEEVVHEKVHDKLTDLFNRQYFDESLQQQIHLATRYRSIFSILFLDLDNFKKINDSYGHLAGDEALRRIAEIINNEKRDSDIAARYGGEEFVVLMPNTDSVSSFVLGERLRKIIEKVTIRYQEYSFKLTISGGIASYPFHTQSPQEVLQLADDALYLSKGSGRNRISLYKKEKRRYLRVNIDQPVIAKELDFLHTQTFNGIGKNICVGGLLFENPEPLPLGSLITIKLKIPGITSDPLILIGTVVRVEAFEKNRYDIGITTSFKELDQLVIDGIGSIVKSSVT